ncbi:protein-L-isoaspartate(D-aspartate) O-methyltransferase [Burkholderiaceae bacterium FT117]|uniref:protein-L-isoaspartate(D-aspartate) O-methyltransferase n=1 Tax=Zeimonas sediminis TaxID=2944268 RepID=UPI0023430661|nr:protein-L-isoaspartate(D-aspartate) O-methyltransferase [Zeimonas sediminis]MCM5571943.1 protein-L-isoaspartate(D-aspartate) O-methyltransferase [Zeimonas sediminis]
MTRRPPWMATLPPTVGGGTPSRSRPGGAAGQPGTTRPAAPRPDAAPANRGPGGAARTVASPLPAPSGLGLASDRARANMVDLLARAGVRDPQVLDALMQVPRHQFVEPALASRAYEDVALPIGHGQTISKPSTVARMIELASAHLPRARRAAAKALEVGTGCGYQAAVMARVYGEVVSIERVRGLHEQARANLRSLRLPNLRLAFGDGHQGVAQGAPYDSIVVAAAGEAVPEPLLHQMRVGGRLVAPVASGGRQALHLVERVSSDEWQLTVLDAVRFVPLRTGTT